MNDDLISRQEAIDTCLRMEAVTGYDAGCLIAQLPSAQPEQTDCEYCHEDPEGYTRPIEKNSRAWLIERGRTMKLRIVFKDGWSECDVLYCPMCGRRLAEGWI